MRVLLIGPYPPPDAGTSIPFKYLVDYLRENSDASVTVINTESGDKSGLPLYHPRLYRPFLLIAWELIKGLHSCDSLLVYGSQRFVATAGSLYTLLASTIYRKRVDVYIAGGAFDQYYFSLGKTRRRFARLCLRRATAIGVQTQLVYHSLKGEFPGLVVIPNWTDLQGLIAIAEAATGDEKETSRDDVTRFIFIGEVIPEKGIIDLAKAFEHAKKALDCQGKAIILDIYGPTRESSRDEVMHTLGYNTVGMRYHGYEVHSILMKELRGSDVLILPTLFPSEGYPGVIIEAMALGKPSIATSFRAIPEILEQGVNGMLFEPGDRIALADCIVAMAIDEEWRHRMGVKAREMVERFDVCRVIPELCKAFGYPLKKG